MGYFLDSEEAKCINIKWGNSSGKVLVSSVKLKKCWILAFLFFLSLSSKTESKGSFERKRLKK